MFKIILLVVYVLNYSQAQNCGEDGTVRAMKKPIYEFSVGFLDRISYGITDHFVYSPLSTWLQLALLADGAQKETLNEIWNVTGLTGYRKRSCYRRKLQKILNNMEFDAVIRSSAVIMDKFFKFKKTFKNKVEALNSVKLLSLDFKDEGSADKANDVLEEKSKNLESIIMPNDFYMRVLLMAEVTYFESAWKHPFNKAQTKPAPFYSEDGLRIGEVNMMNQVGYYKEAEISLINARVLELPFANDRLSMLIYISTKKGIISDIYYLLQNTTLTGVMNSLNKEKAKAVNIYLPKFSIRTEISNIPELLYDMGLKRAFYPELAELKRITDSGSINVSWMSQMATINVTESNVKASAIAENIISNDASDFKANKPFAFMLVDKRTELILFAGIYSNPKDPNILKINYSDYL